VHRKLFRWLWLAIPLFVRGLWNASEYTWPDKLNFFRGAMASMRLLWPELLTIDLFERAPQLLVPVFLMMGRHDYETPHPLAEAYLRPTIPDRLADQVDDRGQPHRDLLGFWAGL
jgi:hypothetical protein